MKKETIKKIIPAAIVLIGWIILIFVLRLLVSGEGGGRTWDKSPIPEQKLHQLRQEGKRYKGSVIGCIEGKGACENWGVAGNVFFNYVYTLHTESEIKHNDGKKVVEIRSFSHVSDTLSTSNHRIKLNLSDTHVKGVSVILGAASSICGFEPTVAGTSAFVFLKKVNGKEVGIPNHIYRLLQAGLPEGYRPDDIIKNNFIGFKQGETILDGKKVQITFENGKGITEITPLDGSKLTATEESFIKRTNFVMDYYLFPENHPEDSWSVNGNVFGGLIDPKLNCRVDGKVELGKEPATSKDELEVGIVKGELHLINDDTEKKACGNITGLSGSCVVNNKQHMVTSARIKGYADYSQVSKNHLLFEAKMATTPEFEVIYEAAPAQ